MLPGDGVLYIYWDSSELHYPSPVLLEHGESFGLRNLFLFSLKRQCTKCHNVYRLWEPFVRHLAGRQQQWGTSKFTLLAKYYGDDQTKKNETAGHVPSMGHNGNAYKVLVSKHEIKIPFWRPRSRWKNHWRFLLHFEFVGRKREVTTCSAESCETILSFMENYTFIWHMPRNVSYKPKQWSVVQKLAS